MEEEMSKKEVDREDFLKRRVRRLTKRIGMAKKDTDIGEIDNLRGQRNAFLKELAEKFDIYYWVDTEGKSCFGSLLQQREFYENNPEAVKTLQGTQAMSELFLGRRKLMDRQKKIESMKSDEVKDFVTREMVDEKARLEKLINDIAKEIGEKEVEFDKLDEDDPLDGIDLDL